MFFSMFFHWNTFHAHNLLLLKIITYIIYQLGLYILGSRIIGYKSIIILSRPSSLVSFCAQFLFIFFFNFSALVIHFEERTLNEFGQIRLQLIFLGFFLGAPHQNSLERGVSLICSFSNVSSVDLGAESIKQCQKLDYRSLKNKNDFLYSLALLYFL